MPDAFQYDVALSFAGEDRLYVGEVAAALAERSIRVFYDEYEKATLWGKDLYSHLSDVYQNQAEFAILFISEHYAKKVWTNLERTNAQARSLRENREYILPARFDSTEIPGLPETISCVDLRGMSPTEFAKLVLAKISHPFQQLPEPYAQVYYNRLRQRVGYIKVLGMEKPIPLSNVYVGARVHDRVQHRHPLPQKYYYGRLRENAPGKLEQAETSEMGGSPVDAFELLQHTPRVFLLGRPGAGKTTFLKHLALRAIQGELTPARLPIYLPLQTLSQHRDSIIDHIVREFEACGFSQARDFLLYALSRGDCLLLFDGLDELTKESSRRVDDLLDFCDKYSGNTIVISCRLAANDYVLESFQDVQVASFQESQIFAFVEKWFGNDAQRALDLINELRAPENAGLMEISTLPLLLTLVCLVFDDHYQLPENKSQLFKEAVDVLLRRWDASRNVRRDEHYRSISGIRREGLLAYIGYTTLVESTPVFSRQRVENLIGNYLDNLRGLQIPSLDVDSNAILDSIEAHHGLLIQIAKYQYSFSHQSLHDYFAARYFILNNNADPRSAVALFTQDERWSEVVVLISNLIHDATDFIIALHHENSQFVEGGSLGALFGFLRQNFILPAEFAEDTYGLYAEIIWGAFRSDRRTSGASSRIFRTAERLATTSRKYMFSSKSVSDWLARRLGMTPVPIPRFTDLPESDLIKLARYLDGCELILRCLTSESYITREVRAGIRRTLVSGLALKLPSI